MIKPSEKEVVSLRQEFKLAMVGVGIFDQETLEAFKTLFNEIVDDEGTPGYESKLNDENAGITLSGCFIGFCAGKGYNITGALKHVH